MDWDHENHIKVHPERATNTKGRGLRPTLPVQNVTFGLLDCAFPSAGMVFTQVRNAPAAQNKWCFAAFSVLKPGIFRYF